MAERHDLIDQCAVESNTPPTQMQERFCSNCYQIECSRSLFGTTKFDQRVSTWEERLFNGVPRMPKEDPRYLELAKAGFQTIEVPSKVTVALTGGPQWHDPRDLPTVNEAPALPEKKAPALFSPREDKIDNKSDPTPAVPVTPGVKNLPRHLLLMNAPEQPLMLPGSPEPKPPADPWAGPVQKEDPLPPAPVVKRGARIKFGGGGGVE